LSSLETNSSQQKELSSALAERYSEAQRELTKRNNEIERLRELVKTGEDTTKDCQLKLRAQEEELRSLSLHLQEREKEYDSFKSQSHSSAQTIEQKYATQLNKSMQKVFDHQAALQDMEARLADSRQKYEALERDTEQRIRTLVEENERKVQTLQEEYEGKCREVAESNGQMARSAVAESERRYQALEEENEKLRSHHQSFEDYKARAQKTLKQANATATNLSSRVSELEEENRSKEKTISILTEDLRGSAIETDRLRNQITELR
jgi:chromosome segregation ATPase